MHSFIHLCHFCQSNWQEHDGEMRVLNEIHKNLYSEKKEKRKEGRDGEGEEVEMNSNEGKQSMSENSNQFR